jgi:hypothetical protein
MLTAADVKRLLRLVPLEREGGCFAETYRSRATWTAGDRTGEVAPRPLATAIYYLLEPDACSALHRLQSDEVWHFYLGDPVELLRLGPGAESHRLRLGADLAAGERPQAVVPASCWQGARLIAGGAWALLGTSMSPGFDSADFELGRREELAARWPEQRALIEALTRR